MGAMRQGSSPKMALRWNNKTCWHHSRRESAQTAGRALRLGGPEGSAVEWGSTALPLALS